MKKATKITLKILVFLFLAILLANIGINYLLKEKVAHFLETRLPNTIEHHHDAITVNLFSGSVAITNVRFDLHNSLDSLKHTTVSIKEINLKDLGYWSYLIGGKITVDAITIDAPEVVYHKHKYIKKRDSLKKKKGLLKLYKDVVIDKVAITSGSLEIYDQEKDSLVLSTQLEHVIIEDLFVSNETLKEKIPVRFGNYTASVNQTFLRVSSFENLEINSLNLENKDLTVHQAKLKTKYSEQELSKHITKERDHFKVILDSLVLKEIDFGFSEDQFFASSSLLKIGSPRLELYRDKLVADDLKRKPLYSKMLRTLPILLTVDSLAISNANIIYKEKVKELSPAGVIYFSKFNLNASKLSNTYIEPNYTDINVNAQFMGVAPLKANWKFDVQDPNDTFSFEANLGHIKNTDLNGFTEPNLLASLSGEINETRFTIHGNNTSSNVEMDINFEDFSVAILNKKGKKKKKLLSSIANLILPSNSKKGTSNFKHGSAAVERDLTKSFFNYLWLNVKGGLINSMTGL